MPRILARRSSFLALSDEVYDKIVQELPPWSRLSLSLVSKRLRRATLPFIFSSLRIRTRREAFKFIYHLISPPPWTEYIKSLSIEIPFWEVNATSRIRREKGDFAPEIYHHFLDPKVDYLAALRNVERIVFTETALVDDLDTIDYVLRAQRLGRLKEFIYTSNSTGIALATSVDTFLCRHPYLVTLELPPPLAYSPSGLDLGKLTKFTGSPRFFLQLVSAPNLSHIKLLMAPATAAHVLISCIRSLSWVSASVSHLEVELGTGFSLELVESAAKYLTELESLKIKWDVDAKFNSKRNIKLIGALLLRFDYLKEFDLEAHVPLVEDTPTTEVPLALSIYCPTLVSCGWLSQCWTRSDVAQPWAQRHRWK